jgi:hypothetical protein
MAGSAPAPLSAEVMLRRVRARCPRRLSPQPFHAPVPPSLHRVRSGYVPLLRRYYKALRLPDDLPAWLRFLRQRGTTATRCSLTEAGGRPSASGLGFSPDAHRPLVVESSGSPRFLGLPPVCVPRSSTPARPQCLAILRHCGAAFRCQNGVGSRDDSNLSGLNHAARILAVYASQPGSHRHHARLASGWGPPLPGGG